MKKKKTSFYQIFQVELVKIEQEIEKIRAEMIKTANFTPGYQWELSWPIGNQPEFRAKNRFDVLGWTYFNMTHVFLQDDFSTVEELDSDQKKDIEYVIKTSVEKIIKNNHNKLKFNKLYNGYWKLDNSRGVDYLLDVGLFTESGEEIRKRIQVCKPLGQVEILPVPYVTENSRINMITIVDSQKKDETLKFLAHYADVCMDKKDKILLTVVILF